MTELPDRCLTPRRAARAGHRPWSAVIALAAGRPARAAGRLGHRLVVAGRRAPGLPGRLPAVVPPASRVAARATRPAGDRAGLDGVRVALIPLVWLLWTVVDNGLPAINGQFLTYSMRNVIGDEQGGIYHAIIGTLLITLAAAVHLGPGRHLLRDLPGRVRQGKSLARWVITFLVDVMTGIPSIVAGLFALALFVLIFGPAIRLGLRRLGRAVAADDPDRGALDRGDAPAGPRRPARGVVRPGRAEVADDRQGRAARPRSAASSPASCWRSPG